MNIHEALNHYWIKGNSLLLDEKEKCGNAGVFLTYLLTDHIKSFNDYVNARSTVPCGRCSCSMLWTFMAVCLFS